MVEKISLAAFWRAVGTKYRGIRHLRPIYAFVTHVTLRYELQGLVFLAFSILFYARILALNTYFSRICNLLK